MASESRSSAGTGAATGAPPSIALPVDRVVRILLATIAVLLVADVAVLVLRHGFGHPYVHGLAWRFDFDNEGNVPTLFSSLVLFGSSIVTAAIAVVARREGAPDWRWWGLAAGFFYLGFDEGAQLHELVTGRIRPQVLAGTTVAYVVAATALLALAVILFSYGRFFRHLPGPVRDRCLVAAVLYLASVAGLEVVGWKVWDTSGIDSLPFSVLATIEETGEMLAGVLFLRAFMNHLASRTDRILIRLS